MARKTAERHDALRKRLLDIAERTVIQHGLDALKARELAREADCAAGAIYTVFDGMRDLVLAVNGRTFKRLGMAVSSYPGVEDASDPVERLVALSHGYLDFAINNVHAWRCLFDVEMRADGPVPDWYLTEMGKLFEIIAVSVRKIFPELSERDTDLMTRALFSSVHGIVRLGIERRISGVPRRELERMLALVLRRLAA